MRNLRGMSHLPKVPDEPKAGHICAPCCAGLSQQGSRLRAALLHVLQRAYMSSSKQLSDYLRNGAVRALCSQSK